MKLLHDESRTLLLGHKGHSRALRFLLGSTSDKVVDHAPSKPRSVVTLPIVVALLMVQHPIAEYEGIGYPKQAAKGAIHEPA
jgi:hypothetical protein